MTVLTEGLYTGEYILTEANGNRSRDTGVVASGETLVAGAVVQLTADEYITAVDLAVDPLAISYAPVDASAAAVEGAVVTVRDAEVKKSNLGYPAGMDDTQKSAIDARLAAQGIKVVA